MHDPVPNGDLLPFSLHIFALAFVSRALRAVRFPKATFVLALPTCMIILDVILTSFSTPYSTTFLDSCLYMTSRVVDVKFSRLCPDEPHREYGQSLKIAKTSNLFIFGWFMWMSKGREIHLPNRDNGPISGTGDRLPFRSRGNLMTWNTWYLGPGVFILNKCFTSEL